MDLEKIQLLCKCCVSEKPLSTSKHINMVQLQYKATWNFPVWGNVLTKIQGMAVAYVHDDVIDKDGAVTGDVKYAVEFKGNEIIYHSVETLEKK